MKEILSVSEEFGDVDIRVPEFSNFGEKMREIEKQSCDLFLGGDDSSAELDALIENVGEEAALEQIAQRLEDACDALESTKEVVKEMTMDLINNSSAFGKMDEAEARERAESIEKEIDEFWGDLDEGFDLDTEDDEDEDREYDRTLLSVAVPYEAQWNDEFEARLDQFLVKWPEVKVAVLVEMKKYYDANCDEAREWLEGIEEPESLDLISPKDPTLEQFSNLCVIQQISLHENTSIIGVSGSCTWDEEHGFGVLLKDWKVVEAGPAAISFS